MCVVSHLSGSNEQLSLSEATEQKTEQTSHQDSSDTPVLMLLQSSALSILNTIKTDLGFNGAIPETNLQDDILRGARLTLYKLLLKYLVIKGLQACSDRLNLYSIDLQPLPGDYFNYTFNNPQEIIIRGPLLEEVIFTYLPFLALKITEQNCSPQQYHYTKLLTTAVMSVLFGAGHFQHPDVRDSINHAVVTFASHLLTTHSCFEHQKAPLSPLISHMLNNAWSWCQTYKLVFSRAKTLVR